MLSHATLQQNGSAVQICVVQGSAALVNGPPTVQRLRLGARTPIDSGPPAVCVTTDALGDGARVEVKPKKKLEAPGGPPPAHTGLENVNVMLSPLLTADDRPIVPIPPPVTTNT